MLHTRQRSAAWEGIRIALLCMLISVFGLWIVYQFAERALFAGLRSHLEDIASVTASQIDAEAHNKLAAFAEPGSESYAEASAPLLRLREQVPDVYYAYTLSFRDGKPTFVLDSSYYIKNQSDTTVIAMPGEVYEEAPPSLIKAMETMRPESSEKPYTDKWGTFLSAFAPFRDSSGQAVGSVGVDISMEQLAIQKKPVRLALVFGVFVCLFGSTIVGVLRARAYRKLMRREAELIVARADAERGERAAQEAEQTKSVFLATMSHEIRTPLNGVLGMAETLSQSSLDEEQKEQLQAIRNSGNLLLVMLNDILDFSKIESGLMSAHVEPVCLPDLIKNAANLYRASAENKGLKFIVDCPPGISKYVLADPTRTSQILGNLLSNATKFTTRGEVRLKIIKFPESESVVGVSVEDTGIGIPKDRLKELFVPFSQLNSALNRSVGGTGLGLVISRRLAEIMNGSLTVQSDEGKGSCFCLSLPVTARVPKETEPEKEVALPLSRASSLRVLVAEDVAINRQVAGLMLKKIGIIPTYAEDGAEAIQLWREQRPDVILMDVQMPHVDGQKATREIRKECGDSTNPWIIALTGGVMTDDRREALNVGMNDFLEKPISIAKLAAALANVPSISGDSEK